MGVRGLTSYIARNAELYLKPHELHDCDLVIDGDNLACNLYKDASDCNSAFGGDYDEYYRTVVAFFHLLFECNIHPFVLLDGGYEHKKMRTVEQRLRGKIAIMKHLNPCNSKPIFPLMMREVFVDAARDCGVKVMRCMFEADDELAILARKLDCAVLSYDSDFYIHNVKYIPLVTVTMRVLTKKEKSNIEEGTNLRRCQARNIKKRTKTNNGLKLQQLNDDSMVSTRVPKTVKYLDCCIYKIENLTTGCKLRKDMLPIFAALLGNDYIESKLFKQFFSKVCMKGTNKKISKQQRRIVATLRWLKHESKESALEKILTRMKKEQRENLLTQIKSATCGYNEEKSESFNYFNLDEVEHNRSESSERSNDEENDELEKEDVVEEIKNELIDDLSSDCDEGIDDNTVEVQSDPDDVKSDSDENEKNDFDSSDEQKIEENVDGNNITTTSNQQMFPDWFRQRIYNAQLPRFCVDLLHQQLYVNNPQVENFLYPDCNTVALPILQLLYSLLHFPEKPELRYLSRVIRVTNVEYKRFPSVECGSEFDPTSKSLQAFKDVFCPLKLSTDDNLFEAVKELPNHLQLYFLAIVYWAKKSKHFDLIHFKVLLICVIVLTTVDSKVLPIRDEKLFNKKFKKIIQKERILRAALNDSSTTTGHITERQKKTDKTRELLKDLKPYEKIKFVSKVECLLVQENLLKYYRQPQFVHKEHNEFSSSTMHGFSEFQAVVFQLYTLNVIVNCPFEPIKMGQMYNGQFLYNLYTNLRSRVDVEYYVQNFILRDSPIMYECYQFLFDWFKPFVTFVNKNETKKIGKRIRRKKRSPTQEELKAQSSADVGSGELSESDEDEEFNDLNNKFATLLSLNK